MKRNEGVTLIALIITIIVLLILAGVAFASLTGNDGILKRASDAAEVSRNAEANQTEALKEYENKIAAWEKGGSGGGKTLEEKIADAGLPPEAKDSLSDVVDGVPIPEGFETSSETGENTKEEGLIIEDVKGNEFVWIPVADLEEDGTIDGVSYDQKFGRRLFERSDSLGGTTAVLSKYTEEMPTALTESVEKYGGFYIARYEASYENGKAVSKKSTTATTEPWNNTNGRLWN